jgi:hypothetical protein
MSEVIAAVMGALVVWVTTYVMERSKRNWAKAENAAHLGVVVLVLLERFIVDCAKVAGDDGTVRGQPAGRYENGEEYYVPQTEIPKLDLDGLKVEWRAISPSLMYAIHSIPLDVTESVEHLEHVADNDFPPYDEYMCSRQRQFAELGVRVAGIAQQLQTETGMPSRPAKEWDAESYLRDRLSVFAEREEKRQANAPLDL